MTNVLVIKSSALGDQSASNPLVDDVVASLGETRVVARDVGASPPPHLTPGILAGLGRVAPDGQSVAEAHQARALSDALIAELQAADTIVIGAPMYNFGLPAALKSWFDYVLRAGATFQYTENGPEGLLSGKRVIVVETRGGQYFEGPMASFDAQEPHLRIMLAFMGLTDVTFVRAEGLAMGPEAREAGIAKARSLISGASAISYAA